jgi:hypothetical protein
MATKKHKKTHDRFECIVCDFKCYAKGDWDRHILRAKHLENTKIKNLATKNTKKHIKTHTSSESLSDNENIYECHCGKEFKDRSGLWRHKKKCDIFNLQEQTVSNGTNLNDINNLTNLICELVKSNTDIHKSVIELCKNGTSNNVVNSNNVNSNNKTFNLQVFLNETCKDAMNISDFVESVKLQVSDLENVGKVGYIEGISNIIIKNLNALEVEKRPVHCTDQKREVMYVKEDNVWEKEDEANKKLRKAIRNIAHKNICMFKEFKEKYPDYDDYDSKRNSQYNTIVYESMGGKGDNDYEKDTKIIKKIAKVVGIEKS